MKSLSNYKGLLLPVLLLACSIVEAERIDLPTAAKVASSQAFVMQKRMETCSNHSCIYSFSESEGRPLCGEGTTDTLAYVFALEPGGFVVVTADNDLVPVIAYAEQGSFPWDENPENVLLHMLRKDLSLRLEAITLLPTDRIEEYHREWEDLMSGDPLYLDPGESWPPAGSTSTGGWVQTAWHQDSPYNDRCPIDPETGERCVVGCVATAMAQIVNYWQYPESVTFTEADNYVGNRKGIEIYAPDASIEYVDYNGGNPSDSMCAAISYACGVGSKMDYSSTASGASLTNTSISFLRHFNYVNSIFVYALDDYTGDTLQFYRTLEDNIKDSLPVMLGIGGHAIVCDGFRETLDDNEWHLNYGWGYSSSTCWYKLPDGMPYGYTNVYYGILNIYPPTRYLKEPVPDTEKVRILSFPSNPFVNSTDIVYTLPEDGIVEIRIYDLTGRCVFIQYKTHLHSGIYGVHWSGKDQKGNILPSGNYIVYIKCNDFTDSRKITLIRQ